MNTLSPEWCKKIQEELIKIRKETSNKADMSLIEQIERQEVDRKRLFAKAKNAPTTIKSNDSTMKVCDGYVESGDIDKAFLTVLRYIENISNTKANSEEIKEKATRSYVESLFQKVDIMNQQQLSQKYTILNSAIGSRLQQISQAFDSFSQSIEDRLDFTIGHLSRIEDNIISLTGMVQTQSKTSQLSTSKNRTATDQNTNNFEIESLMNPRKPKKPKNSGIVMPTYYHPKPEPTAKALCPAITVKSQNQRKARSLLVTKD